MEYIVHLWDSIPEQFKNVGFIIGLLSAIATITPTPKDNAILVILKMLINAGGMNFDKTTNAERPPTLKELQAKKRHGP